MYHGLVEKLGIDRSELTGMINSVGEGSDFDENLLIQLKDGQEIGSVLDS